MGRGTARGGHLVCTEDSSRVRIPGAPPFNFERELMESSEVRIGRSLQVSKTDRTEFNGWGNPISKEFTGYVGMVTEIHTEYPAIQLTFPSDEHCSNVHWYHADDLIPIKKVKHKKQIFDPKNLILGV